MRSNRSRFIDLVPGGHEVAYELLLRIAGCVDLRDGAQLRIRTEDEVDGGGRPLRLAGCPIPALVDTFGRGGYFPLRAHVEQVYEEVVGQCLRAAGEHAEP